VKGERVERRLAAILAADVVGYSRLMGEDEEGTLAALKALRRELVDPKIAEHHGRIVKTPANSGASHRRTARKRGSSKFAADSSLEGDGFELTVPPRRNFPRARHVVSAHGPTSSERH
jgi:class 3 adenylate cyclase